MALTVDETVDLEQWTTDLSFVGDWLFSMWGIRPGISSPTTSSERVHPSCQAAAGWLNAMWGFAI